LSRAQKRKLHFSKMMRSPASPHTPGRGCSCLLAATAIPHGCDQATYPVARPGRTVLLDPALVTLAAGRVGISGAVDVEGGVAIRFILVKSFLEALQAPVRGGG
jgi:hypothetical protein